MFDPIDSGSVVAPPISTSFELERLFAHSRRPTVWKQWQFRPVLPVCPLKECSYAANCVLAWGDCCETVIYEGIFTCQVEAAPAQANTQTSSRSLAHWLP